MGTVGGQQSQASAAAIGTGLEKLHSGLCRSFCSGSRSGFDHDGGACTQLCSRLCSSVCGFIPPVPSPPTSDFTDIAPKPFSPSIILGASISVLAAAVMFFAFLAVRKFLEIWRRRQASWRSGPGDPVPEDQLDGFVDHPIWYIRTVGLQASIINAIAVVRYQKGEGLIEGQDCAVCLSEFREGEMLRLLPKCSHAFHLPCIDAWLRAHTNCPICRAGVVKSSGEVALENPGLVDEARIEIVVEREEDEVRTESDSSEARARAGSGESSQISGPSSSIRRSASSCSIKVLPSG